MERGIAIERPEKRIVPVGDFAVEDLAIGNAVETQPACNDIVDLGRNLDVEGQVNRASAGRLDAINRVVGEGDRNHVERNLNCSTGLVEHAIGSRVIGRDIADGSRCFRESQRKVGPARGVACAASMRVDVAGSAVQIAGGEGAPHLAAKARTGADILAFEIRLDFLGGAIVRRVGCRRRCYDVIARSNGEQLAGVGAILVEARAGVANAVQRADRNVTNGGCTSAAQFDRGKRDLRLGGTRHEC